LWFGPLGFQFAAPAAVILVGRLVGQLKFGQIKISPGTKAHHFWILNPLKTAHFWILSDTHLEYVEMKSNLFYNKCIIG